MGPPRFVVGLQSEINVVAESLEPVVAIFVGDVGPDTEVLRVFEQHHGSIESVASFIRNHSAHLPRGDL
jgi:hypothetical protein